jgi:2-polyprenyl-6-hydroxyphenyl methylase/3-demethylubiquinone-9 3-methyltransferase
MSCTYEDAAASCHCSYLWPSIFKIVSEGAWRERRVFDLGCGNGAISNMLSEVEFEVTGVDTSESGVALANKIYPHLKINVGSAYDDLAAIYGTFPLVVSFEVIEHCMDVRRFAKTFFDLISPDGVGPLSTPYHGYLKNLALSLLNKWDSHHDLFWEGGHVKLFSQRTLTRLLGEAGFREIQILRVGRVPSLAKSMIAVVRK